MPNSFKASFDGLACAAFVPAGIADPAVFRRKGTAIDIDCTVFVDENVQLQGDQSQVINDATTLICFVADIGSQAPVRGDTFTIGEQVFTVDSISDHDESRFVCIVAEFDQ